MQITLNQDEIGEALESYVRTELGISDEHSVEVDLKAGRGENGYTATLDIMPSKTMPKKKKPVTRSSAKSDDEAKDEAPAPKTTKPKAVDTKPEPEVVEESADEVMEETQAEDSSPETEAETDSDTDTAVEDSGDDTSDDEAPKTSIFNFNAGKQAG